MANAVPATRGQLKPALGLSMSLVSVIRVAARFVLAALRRNDPPRSGGGNLLAYTKAV
jgi:hypothetical protein